MRTAEQKSLRSLEPPSHQECVTRAKDFCARTGLSATQFGELLRKEYGRGGRRTIRTATLWLFYLRGERLAAVKAEELVYMDELVLDFCNRNTPKPKERGYAEPLLETDAYRQIRAAITAAIEEGTNALIYGPPSSEKSFISETVLAQRYQAGKRDAFYVYCDANIAPFPLLERIASEAEVWVRRAWTREHYLSALIEAFGRMDSPPALIFDEAQHLSVEALEIVRGLHDRTRRRGRPGAGIILMGSHTLYRDFMHPSRRPRLEQWLQRLTTRVQLSGMTATEVLELAGRAWGNGKKAKFTADQEKKLLETCRVIDPYATDSSGKPLADVPTYYSSRKLLHFIREKKKAGVGRVLAEEVA
jgi:type II secretory pathway predicted ATPase ExeA